RCGTIQAATDHQDAFPLTSLRRRPPGLHGDVDRVAGPRLSQQPAAEERRHTLADATPLILAARHRGLRRLPRVGIDDGRIIVLYRRPVGLVPPHRLVLAEDGTPLQQLM